MLYLFQLRLANGEPADPRFSFASRTANPPTGPKPDSHPPSGARLRDHAEPEKRLRVLRRDGDTLTVEPVTR
jgi:hypothetical protein